MNLKKTIIGSTALLGVFATSFAASNALWIDHESDDYKFALPSYEETVTWDGVEAPKDDYGNSVVTFWNESSIRKLEETGELNRILEVDMKTIGAVRANDYVYVPYINFDGDILQGTTQKLFAVSDPSQCNTESDEYNDALPYTKEDDHYGNGALVDYSQSVESLGNNSSKVYVCYSAKFPKSTGQEGKHTNTATVTGKSDGSVVENQDSWSASVKKKEVTFTEAQIQDQIKKSDSFDKLYLKGGYGSNLIYNGPDDSVTKTPSETYNPVSPTVQP